MAIVPRTMAIFLCSCGKVIFGNKSLRLIEAITIKPKITPITAGPLGVEKLKNLITRALTGAVYVTLTVGSILFSKYSFFAYFTIILAYTIFEFYRLCKIGGNKPQLISGIFTAIFVFVAFFLFFLQLHIP